MSLSACVACWCDVCTCGFNYRHLSWDERQELAKLLIDEQAYQTRIKQISEELHAIAYRNSKR